MDESFETVRVAFGAAARWFAETVHELDRAPVRWDDPALGEWSLRDLVGHTSRALSTVEEYLRPGSTESDRRTVDYYRAVRGGRADPDEVAERGRRAGRDLGVDLPESVDVLVRRVTGVVAGRSADARVETPVGAWRLEAYLPTRVVELVVHTGDLRTAGGLDGQCPEVASRRALVVLGALVADAPSDDAPRLLTALTGRSALAAGFTVL
ncbi:maleylpyruvate isomerase N-terminal domain-containing protein [Frigoribacterium sp. PhB24]|uniref:maleylpyruvate isomerase N-terminal domain-containing protein n=1 Tax=Frigoribacterium sp. PhB24 TaxID=2485204 RepID=UPI000F49A5C0|nr:maleylpyruvate isomerase N-terminal domain-containing protein [Frigoribacterium sp. PhB24]ROS52639.1 mycothiol maleylpyruvate isomerase-like protein [Frigoribacterium sp. PhB24]